jgi:hypothetical protein
LALLVYLVNYSLKQDYHYLLQLVEIFDVRDFQASSGWLDSIKKINLISQKILTGKSNEV